MLCQYLRVIFITLWWLWLMMVIMLVLYFFPLFPKLGATA